VSWRTVKGVQHIFFEYSCQVPEHRSVESHGGVGLAILILSYDSGVSESTYHNFYHCSIVAVFLDHLMAALHTNFHSAAIIEACEMLIKFDS
jgi:hypothetical protein